MAENEQGMIKAMEEMLKLYDIQLEEGADTEEAHDYSEVIGKTQAKLDDLNEAKEKILNKMGMSRDELEVYASNPNNFTQEEWEALQSVREACEKYKKESQVIIEENHLDEAVKIERKKQPQRFAKKKNWIPL